MSKDTTDELYKILDEHHLVVTEELAQKAIDQINKHYIKRSEVRTNINLDEIAELFWDGYEHQECDDSCPVSGKYEEAKSKTEKLIQEAYKRGYIDCGFDK